MAVHEVLPGLGGLHERGTGDPEIRIAVLDGPVDLSHECFRGARFEQVATLASPHPGLASPHPGPGKASRHGTHIASVIFGQPGSSVPGLAPSCSGLIIPVFREYEEGRLRQLDLARAMEQAVLNGAHIINISGGERSVEGGPDPFLRKALDLCEQNHVLVVAAAGNDGCECLHIPACLESVLAVGALDRDGIPLVSSNWGPHYRSHGVVALGQDVPGAEPGGGVGRMSGTSAATAVVTGVAALLLSQARQRTGVADPPAIAAAILATADQCGSGRPPQECEKYLAGEVNVARARAYIESGGMMRMPDLEQVTPSEVGDHQGPVPGGGNGAQVPAPAPTTAGGSASARPALVPPAPVGPRDQGVSLSGSSSADTCGCAGVKPSGDCACGGSQQAAGAAATGAAATMVAPAMPSYVYALGTVGFDFGTEARRDTFRQSMPDVPRDVDGTPILVSPNPFDVFQLTDYLNRRPSESTKLIWTLNLDLTPIYALEAEVAYPEDVYSTLREALRNEALPQDDPNHVSRVSIPGVITNRTVRLFSGQVLPVVVVQPRGLFEWNEPALVNSVVESIGPDRQDVDEQRLRRLIRIFLDKVYFECRNLGMNPSDRALNFAATNAFQFGSGIVTGILSGRLVPNGDEALYTLDSIRVSKSPYCRMDSDCWDVIITWFDPENERRAKSVFQFTIDVSDELPVSLAPAHQYLTT